MGTPNRRRMKRKINKKYIFIQSLAEYKNDGDTFALYRSPRNDDPLVLVMAAMENNVNVKSPKAKGPRLYKTWLATCLLVDLVYSWPLHYLFILYTNKTSTLYKMKQFSLYLHYKNKNICSYRVAKWIIFNFYQFNVKWPTPVRLIASCV